MKTASAILMAISVATLLLAPAATADAQRTHPGHGAMSAQDSASVTDAATGSSTPTGLVQFQINGTNGGDPVTLVVGQAAVTATTNGDEGINNVTAFYEGDSTYAESLSSAVPVTISAFTLSSTGVTAALGSAAIAPVTVNVASNYTSAIAFTCTLPASLTEAACFVNPSSATGTGSVSLTVNTTPAHPLKKSQSGGNRMRAPDWMTEGGVTSVACLFLLAPPRRRARYRRLFAMLLSAGLLLSIGCSGTAKLDPGTVKGTYAVQVRGSSGSGTSQFQTSVNVPITIQ